jgi:hypothetical protein
MSRFGRILKKYFWLFSGTSDYNGSREGGRDTFDLPK